MSPEFERLVKDAGDDGLREFIALVNTELDDRDRQRKAAAKAQAESILQNAQAEADAVLHRAGLARMSHSPARKRGGKPRYRAGAAYRHPDNSALSWNGRGVRPKWIRELESAGRQPVSEH